MISFEKKNENLSENLRFDCVFSPNMSFSKIGQYMHFIFQFQVILFIHLRITQRKTYFSQMRICRCLFDILFKPSRSNTMPMTVGKTVFFSSIIHLTGKQYSAYGFFPCYLASKSFTTQFTSMYCFLFSFSKY